jgi:flagellar motor switch protein FliN
MQNSHSSEANPTVIRLFSSFPDAWKQAAAEIAGVETLCAEDYSGAASDLDGAVAPDVIREANMGFVSVATGDASGALAFLFNRQAMEQLERLSAAASGSGLPQTQKIIGAIVSAWSSQADAKTQLSPPESVSFEGDWLARVGGTASQASVCTVTVGEQVKLSLTALFFPNVDGETLKTELTAPDPSPAPRVVKSGSDAWLKNVSRLFNVEVDLIVRFGATTLALNEIIRMGIGSMLELNRAVDEPVDILVNDQLIARGEVVVIDGYYGVRVCEIISTVERTAMIA